MIKTWEQAHEVLEQMRKDAVPDEDLQVDDILIDRDGVLLVRRSALTFLGGEYFFGVNYEMWLDEEMYNQGVYGDYFEDGDEIVYCIPLVGADDEAAIVEFEKTLLEEEIV